MMALDDSKLFFLSFHPLITSSVQWCSQQKNGELCLQRTVKNSTCPQRILYLLSWVEVQAPDYSSISNRPVPADRFSAGQARSCQALWKSTTGQRGSRSGPASVTWTSSREMQDTLEWAERWKAATRQDRLFTSYWDFAEFIHLLDSVWSGRDCRAALGHVWHFSQSEVHVMTLKEWNLSGTQSASVPRQWQPRLPDATSCKPYSEKKTDGIFSEHCERWTVLTVNTRDSFTFLGSDTQLWKNTLLLLLLLYIVIIITMSIILVLPLLLLLL